MKKIHTFLGLTVLSAILAISCTYDLVSAPTSSGGDSNPAAYPDSIQPPSVLTASQGGYRSVELNWDCIKNAVSYIVYSAETPFDTFQQIYKTTGTQTSCTIEEECGSSKYYCVSAVNYYGTVSSKSKVVYGTSLATPVITDIIQSSEGTSLTLNWWMDNCDSDTYQDSVKFIISVYDSSTASQSILNMEVDDGSSRSAEITGLSPNTDYYFQVQAECSLNPEKKTSSDLTSKSTAHRIIPDAAENFTVSQGTSTTEVLLSWNLPSLVEYYDASTNSYVYNPVYFTVNRKLYGNDDSTYECLARIGSGTASGLTQTFAEYIPGAQLTFTDSTAVRGKQYVYMIQSYTDNTNKIYTSDSSKTQGISGWTISDASVSINSSITYDENDHNIISKIDGEFTFAFQPYNIQYTYLITRTKTSLDLSTTFEETIIQCSNSLSSIKSFKDTFTDPKEEAGYYKYKIYILPYQTASVTQIPAEENVIEILEPVQQITVTEDARLIPSITNFKVSDGYKDKFLLSWDSIENAAYTITYTPVVDGHPQTEVSVNLQKENSSEDGFYTVEGSTVYYECPAASGDSRVFTLTADTGLKNSASLDQIYHTLGTALLTEAAPDYDKITVSWPAVQMADTNYTVTAHYQDSSKELAVEDVLLLTEYDENQENFTCVLNKPEGYNNPAVSGKPVTLTVTATNTKTGDTTSSSLSVHTLGPALINASAATIPNSSNSLTLRWAQVDGAEKYLIYRTMYSDSSANSIAAADTYIVDAQTLEVSEYNGQSTAGRVNVKSGSGFFIFTDKQTDAAETYGYQTHQEKIQWGLPFGYVVLPVKAGGSQDDFSFEENSLKMSSSSKVNYGTLSDVKTAAYGYGLNLMASKSESASKVSVQWDKPYFTNLTPTLYRRQMYDSSAKWTKVATLGQGVNSYQVTISKEDISKAFEYAVQYEASSSCEFVESFTQTLANTLEDSLESPRYIYPDGVKAEPLNKGYVLALADFDAAYGGQGTSLGNSSYYQENVTWTEWDYDVRALGPDSFTVDLMNYNLSSDWNTICTAAISDKQESLSPVTNLEDTSVTAVTSGLFIKPVSLSAASDGRGTTDGLLKVLRDAKHYYSVNLTASHTGTTITSRQGEDASIYAYRQISDEELAKTALYIFAYGFYLNDGGNPDYSNIGTQFKYGGKNTIQGLSGYANFTDRSTATFELGAGKYKQYYDFKSYCPELYTPAGILVSSPVKITTDTYSCGIKGASDNYIYTFRDSHTITIENSDDTIPLDYSAVLGFSCSNNESITITITRNGSTSNELINTNNDNELRKAWFPMQIHSDKNYELQSSAYGWWPSN